ncbi:glycoside hydrolase family 13 protein [Shewanella sp. SW36]|uniref:glycoside hydrolase family 13 protein n=1 Tax=unclassified Shewanella TaxID=196818 RepID=UPI0021DB608E|nr:MULTISPECIES: glycoside hydrolase family 13 protein [unclassified Shewanella]MCU7977077.1 glycoside hydrolase family 13 protein [Shewanella sp. SW36]MCU7992318.1 glycoside hydrolase family 13 protein [Shewanella sp. SW1]MCU8034990.1 glycoside hydrolase family 13 protein [Shewanella sp. SM71]MCU8053760.1 glycoside hydrolase family 13 protein [Shewanella sp. SM43]MCU8096860.1 glycoside hydrolase family 13 protein [Shewanella sp. SM102]
MIRQNLMIALYLCLVCSSFNTAYANTFEPDISTDVKLEPAFWWGGMQNPELQLMLYSRELPSLPQQIKVDIQGKGITLKSLEHTDNPHYLFINLDLSQAAPQTFELIISNTDSASKADTPLYRLPYTLQGRAKGSRERQGFSNKDVIYLITPDRFANGDTSNDNQADMLEQVAANSPSNLNYPDARHGGDIAGISQHLAYLAKLGVTQLWINPLLENNQAQYSYHGYSITNLYRVDPRFGSNEDYKALVAKANKLGLGVIKDVVVNHIGSNHWWLNDLPSQDWLNDATKTQLHNRESKPNLTQSADTKSSAITSSVTSPRFTSHRRTTVQDPYAAAQDHIDFVDGWFTDTMPDLNQSNPKLATYLIQNSIWWVEYAGLSGIREDTYSYADKGFLAKWSKAVMAEYPNFNIVGEEWTANPITVSYWQKGKINADGYTSDLPSLMDFPLYEKLIASLNEPESWDTGFIKLYEMLANDLVYAEPSKLVLFEGNHDTNRIFSLVKENIDLYKMALTYVLTAKRIPQLFYGTEVLMTSPTEGRHDGVVRSDFPGGFANSATNAFTGQGLSEPQRQAQQFVRTLLNYRKQSLALQSGDLLHFVPQDGIYVQFRCLLHVPLSAEQKAEALKSLTQHNSQAQHNACTQPSADKVMVIYNKNDKAVTLDVNRFASVLGDNRAATDIISGNTVSLNQALALPHAGVTILELKARPQLNTGLPSRQTSNHMSYSASDLTPAQTTHPIKNSTLKGIQS